MRQFIKYVFLFFAILSGLNSNPVLAQSDSKYSESMTEVIEYMDAGEYADALPILKELAGAGHQNGNVNYKTGLCYLNSAKENAKAISYLKSATTDISDTYSNNPSETKAPAHTYLALGDAYRLSYLFKEAKAAYSMYANKVKDNAAEFELAGKRLNECRIAQLLINKPANVKIINLGNTINAGLANFNACISGDGKYMVFTRRLRFYDAVYFCSRTETGWSEPENITSQIGSDGEFVPTGLSFDGSRMLLMSFSFLKGFDLYESVKGSKKWSKVRNLSSLNTSFNDIDAVYSPDGSEVLFSSNRSNGLGGYDIYSSQITDQSNYSAPVNIGEPVNTVWDEKSPAFMGDGKTIVFSSERVPGMGGFDLFYCSKNLSKWGNIYNIGYPLNSTANDRGLNFSSGASVGLISRHENEGFTESDISMVQGNDFSKFRTISVQGQVKLNGNKVPSGKETVYLVDEALKDTLTQITGADSGRFALDLYPGNFKLILSGVDNSGPQSFVVPGDTETPEFSFSPVFAINDVPKLVEVAPQIISDTIFIEDAYFDFNKTTLSANEKEKLSKLIKELLKYKFTRIELAGYSDAKGTPQYNLQLSVKRAEEVMNFLNKNGIAIELISANGHGSTNFVARNTNPDGSDCSPGRALNRRVEIIVIPLGNEFIIHKKNNIPKELLP